MKELNFTDEDFAKAANLLSAFEGRLGYPPNAMAMKLTIRGFLMIAHMEPRTWISGEDEEYRPIITTCPYPAEWLIEQAFHADVSKFPTMFEFRALYEKRFTPRDCRFTCDVAV